MKTVAASILYILCFTAPAVWAQQTVQTSFDYTLTTLRESVDALARENKEQESSNEQIRLRLQAMAQELKRLQADEARVLEQIEAADGRQQKKMESSRSPAARAYRLRQESLAIDEEFGKLTETIAAQEKADQELDSAIKALEKDIRSLMAGEHPVSGVEDPNLVKERDRLNEQKREALVSLQQVRQQWLDLQGIHALGPENAEALRASRDRLAKQLKRQRELNTGLSQQVVEEEKLWKDMASPAGVGRTGGTDIEQETATLKARSQALAREIERLRQVGAERAQKTKAAFEQERSQWESKLADREARNSVLRAELDELRKEMIDLDKKKSSLEWAN